MGLFDRLNDWLGFRKREAKVLVIGLNNSGKSTLVQKFKPEDGRSRHVTPTVGFNVEKFQHGGVGFTAWDMSGHGKHRSLWEHHYREAHAIIFVIDSSDKLRLVVVKDELDLLLRHPDIVGRRVPILFFANKMDRSEALSSVKIAAGLGLERIVDKPWHVCSSNALTGEGLQQGAEWLTSQLRVTTGNTDDAVMWAAVSSDGLEGETKINSILKRRNRKEHPWTKGRLKDDHAHGQGETCDLLVFGYSCKLFRDDERAAAVDRGALLIPCQGDAALSVDRYDCRGMLSSKELQEAEAGAGMDRWLTPAEEKVEKLCDEERYRALYCDEDEEKMYREEEMKRAQSADVGPYGQVGFDYGGDRREPPPEAKPADETTAERDDGEPFIPSGKLTFPPGMNLPETKKQNAIIEKTAKFIAGQGAQMEILLKAKQAGNPHFDFLTVDTTLHPYYRFLLTAIREGKYGVDEETKEVSETKEEREEHYLHPSLASVESAPSIPSIPYKPSADCAYSMLVTKITGRNDNFEEKTEPAPKENVSKNAATSNPESISNEYENQQGAPGIAHAPYPSQTEISRGPVLYNQFGENSTYSSLTTNLMKLEEADLSNPSLDQSFDSNTNSPKPAIKKASALGLTQYYNSEDSDSECDSQSESIEVPPGNEQVIVDKMASYVAKNGNEFEEIVKTKGDPRFCFLDPNHKYHKYYKHKVEVYKRATGKATNSTKDNSKKEKESKTPKIVLPVSFSIKKIKEPEPVLPKPALPYESSSDDDEKDDTEKCDTTIKENVPEEKPKEPDASTIITKTESIPPPIVVHMIEVPQLYNLQALSTLISQQQQGLPNVPITLPMVTKPEPPVLPSAIQTKLLEIKKDIQRRVQELSSPSSSDSEQKSAKNNKKSESRSPQSSKAEKSREDRSPSVPDFIDLTEDLEASSAIADSEKNKIQSERKKKAAAFLSSLKAVPAAPLQQHNTLASAMVKTLHGIQDDGKRHRKRKHKSSSDRRKSKKHKSDRDKSYSSDSDYYERRRDSKSKRKSRHHSKKSRRRSRDRSSSRHRRKSRDKESKKSSKHDEKPAPILELPQVDEEYVTARQKNKLLTSSLKDLVKEARKDLTCSEPVKMAVDIFSNDSPIIPTVSKERSRSKTIKTSSSSDDDSTD